MKRSTANKILTTHVGSIPRPENIRQLLRDRLAGKPFDQAEFDRRVRDAVVDVVRQQVGAGIDIVADGEFGKVSFINYTDDRLSGFKTMPPGDPNAPASSTGASWDRRIDTRREWRAFRDYYAGYLSGAMPPATPPVVCVGPIEYKDEAPLRKDLANLKAAMAAANVDEAFVPAIAPGMVGRGQNQYYATDEEYRQAVAEALRTEYRAIVDAGFLLQIDDPGMGETWDMIMPAPTLAEYRKLQQQNVEIMNHALEGIPEDRVRYHLCWGSWQGPHEGDLALKDIVDIVLRVKAQAYSIEAATPRHSYEWQVWQDVKLPDDKILIPGVIAHTTAVVEHPETIAERLLNYIHIVGPERVIAGADCGFAQGALYERQHPSVMWAKFRAMAEGARLAAART